MARVTIVAARCTHHWSEGRLFGALTCTQCGAEATCVACAILQGMDVEHLPEVYCARHRPTHGMGQYGLLDLAYHCLTLADALPMSAWSLLPDGQTVQTDAEVRGVRVVIECQRLSDAWQVLIYAGYDYPLYCARGPRTALALAYASPGSWVAVVRSLTTLG
jgi:hypothetical protein